MFAPITQQDDANAPLLAHLNPEQRAAVTLPAEHALILAGAGSGKTWVLTTRVVREQMAPQMSRRWQLAPDMQKLRHLPNCR